MKDRRFSQDDRPHCPIHGIPHKTVRTLSDQFLRRVEWKGCALPANGESEKSTGKIQCDASGHQQPAERAWAVDVRPLASWKDPVRHRKRPESWNENGKDQRSNQGRHGQPPAYTNPARCDSNRGGLRAAALQFFGQPCRFLCRYPRPAESTNRRRKFLHRAAACRTWFLR